MILDVGGKDSLVLILNLVKKLKIPHTCVLDYDGLMQCTRKIIVDDQEIKTSSAISAIYRTGGLSHSEIKFIKQLENKIEKVSKQNNKSKIQLWYTENELQNLNKIAKNNNMYIFTKDLEGAIQTRATSKDNKPLKALDRISELLDENKIPNEIKSVMKFIKTKISN